MSKDRNTFTAAGVRHVAVVSFAFKPEAKKVARFAAWLGKAGIRCTVMPGVFMKTDFKMPSDAGLRLADLHGALNDRSVDVIVSSRGGYGSAHLLEKIDWKLMRERNIPVLGYSDITALHLAMFAKKAGVPVSTPVAVEMPGALRFKAAADSLTKALDPSQPPQEISPPRPEVLKRGRASGGIIPANLATLCSVVGTEFMPDMRGKILLIEEVNEKPYQIDRMLTQLRLAGILKDISGLLLGKFIACGSRRILRKIFADFANCVNGPVVAGIRFGHRAPSLCVRLGAETGVSAEGRITVI